MGDQTVDSGVELAPVHYLPSTQVPDAAGSLVEGEVISEEDYQRLTSQRGRALDRYEGYRRDVTVAARTARTAGTRTWAVGKRATQVAGPHAKTGGVFVVRHSSYVLGGSRQLVRSSWRRIQHGEIDDAIREARASNDLDLVARLQQEKRHSANDRWKRIGTQLKVTGYVAVGSVSTWCAASTGIAIWGGIAQLAPGGEDWASLWTEGWWQFNTDTAGFISWLFAFWPWVLAVGVLAGVAGAWGLGRSLGSAPAFAQAGSNMPTQAVVIDETSIARALGGLGLKGINDHLKAGLALQYTVMPHRTSNEDGEKDVGISAQVRLPGGTSAEEVIKKSTKFAANLARASVEVWPSVGEDEGLLNLWVADRGSLDGNAPIWPWMERTDGVDLYQGVPIGRTLDGRTIIAPVDGASYLVGGRPGQGKSQFVRTLAVGAMFDPRARIRVHVLASNNDFAPMRPRLEKYRTGLGMATIESALEEMEELYAELERRGEYMEEHGFDTASEAGFEPIVSVFDEIHQAFQCRVKETREAIASYAEDLSKLARKYGILVIYATQSADATSIPKGVTRQSQQRVAYSLVDQPANDGLLGSGSYKQGITATSLRPGNKNYHGDRGKSVTVGLVPDADWAMCCGFYIDSAVLPSLVEQAMQIQSEAGEQTVQALAVAPEQRDLLEDLVEAMGTESASAADVAGWLRKLAPKWTPYAQLDGKKLQQRLLKEYGYKVPAPGNRPTIDPAKIGQLLAQQATSDLDGQADG